jgi:hypothetical protein
MTSKISKSLAQAPAAPTVGRAGSARVWRVAALAALLVNVGFNYLVGTSRILRVGHGTMEELSAKYGSVFTPAGYAFAIWGVIYLAFLVYAIAQLRGRARGLALPDRLAKPFVAANLFGTAWIIAFQYERLVLSEVIILATLAVAATLYLRASQAVASGEVRPAWRWPFSLYLGWIVVANLACLGATLRALGSAAPLDPAWAIVLLAAAVGVGVLVAVRYADALAPLVVSWAAVAIYVANRGSAPAVANTALVAAVIAAIAAIVGGVGGRFSPSARPGSGSHPADGSPDGPPGHARPST